MGILLFMQEGLRNTITCGVIETDPNCEHLFVIKRMEGNFTKVEVKVDFSPACRSSPGHQLDSCQSSPALPRFNKDHKFYTPSFMVAQDQAKLNQNNSQLFINHSKRVEEYLIERDELLVPKPYKSHRFCLICREHFQDYLTHISFPSHNARIRQSPFYNDIQELCSRMNPLTPTSHKKKITKERKRKTTCKNSGCKKPIGNQKSSEYLATAVQSLQIDQSEAIK